MLHACPSVLPPDIGKIIHNLGQRWVRSPICPKVKQGVAKQWAILLNDWKNDKALPLLVRKGSAVRGSEIVHASGRKIVPCDNSPAQWAYSLAMSGEVPTIEGLIDGFAADRIPVSFAHKKEEKGHRRYHCTLGAFTVNKKKWKLCHIKKVGLKTRLPLEETDIELLKERFFLLLAPENHFLLPLEWGGIGEAKEFINGFIE